MTEPDVRGGLRLDAHKERSTAQPLRGQRARPTQLVLPLDQHAGAPAVPIVKPGERVLLGQPIAEPGGADQRVAALARVGHGRGDRAAARTASPRSARAQHRHRERRTRRALTRRCADELRASVARSSCASTSRAAASSASAARCFPLRRSSQPPPRASEPATAAQRRRVRALHQLRRHADARTRAGCRVRRAHPAARARRKDCIIAIEDDMPQAAAALARCDRRCPRRANPVAIVCRASIRPAASGS